MKLGLHHSGRLEQRLVQSPQMIQAMQILQLSRMDLQERIDQELLENPFLEQSEAASSVEEDSQKGRADERGEQPAQSEAQEAMADQFERWRELEEGTGRPTAAGREASDRKLEAMANTPDKPKSLAAALVEQLAMIDFTPLQRELAEYLIYSFDPRGYLPEGLEAVVEMFAAGGGLSVEEQTREAEPADGASPGPLQLEALEPSTAPQAESEAGPGDGVDRTPTRPDSKGEDGRSSLLTLAYRVLGRLRLATHPALGAQDLRESLALQLEARGETNELIYAIVDAHLDDLMRNRLPHVAKATQAELDDVKNALEVLRELDPSPGGEFGEEVAEAIVPDVFVALVDNELVVQLASERIPPLQLSPDSQDMLNALEETSSGESETRPPDAGAAPFESGPHSESEAEPSNVGSPSETAPVEADGSSVSEQATAAEPGGELVRGPRAELSAAEDPRRWGRRRLEAARWFIEAVLQREKTVLRIAKAVFRHQQGFLERGPKWLKPLRMQEIADETGVHISTVSRAVAGKYAQTPRGIYPLKYFFTSGTRDKSGTQASQVSVQQRLQEIIEREDKQKPLSDDQLAAELERISGIKIARRTVTKYRKALGLGSSSQRKEY